MAIKKIQSCFTQVAEAKRTLRELRILRHLDHPGIIHIRDVLHPTSESSFSNLWVVFDFVDLDLRKLVGSPQTITTAHVQWILHQMLSAIRYLHSAHVRHRDLKPANVLLSGTCDVKICDFGLARVVDEEDWALNEARLQAGPALARQASGKQPMKPPPMQRQMTSHVVTRWYRAPEVLLRAPQYSAPIDMWAIGTIMAEMFTLRPLFPGTSEADEIYKICSVLGTPSANTWKQGLALAQNANFKFPQFVATPLSQLIPSASPEAVDLMTELISE